MGTTYINGAPIYKEEKNYTMPDYTIDNFIAREEWNKEIANNKQGYMGVDIMSMKDFYDAGGYSFVDDYRAELGALDAAYDRALPGYGVKGEQMAQAGMTGSGYGDYLSGQAYALRASGQALARQNIMANSNSFRAAYNSYVAQQKEKREQNLQTVIEKAYASALDPEMFVEMATKLGIPKADAERGKSALEAYYMGVTKNEYGLTDAEQEQANGIAEQILQGVGTYQNTDAIKKLILATATNKNAESIYHAALQQTKASVLAELQGMIANGGYVSEEDLAKYKAYYGFTDEEFDGITTGMKDMVESGGIKLNSEQQTTANAYSNLFKIALNGGDITNEDGEVVQSLKAGDYATLDQFLANNSLNADDPIVQAGIEEFRKITNVNYETAIANGTFVSKSALDSAKKFGAITDEQYQTLLGSAQEKTSEKLIEAIKSDDINKYIEVIGAFGVDTTDISEENAEALLVEVVDNACKSGDITRDHKVAFETELLRITTDTITNQTDLNKFILSLQQKGKSTSEIRKHLKIESSRVTCNHAAGGELTAHLKLPNGKECKYKLYDAKNGYTDSEKEITKKLNSAISLSNQNVVIYNGKLYYKRDSQWQEASIAMDTPYSESSSYVIKALMSVLPTCEELQEKSEKTKKELQNTLDVTQRRNSMRVATE